MPRKINAAVALVQIDRALKILKDDDFKNAAYMLKMAKLELVTIANNIRQYELEQLIDLASAATAQTALAADNEDRPKR